MRTVQVPQLRDGESVTDAIRRLRSEIGRTRAELAYVRDAPLPAAEVKAALVDHIDRMAMQGRPRVAVEGTQVVVKWPDEQQFNAPGEALVAPSGGDLSLPGGIASAAGPPFPTQDSSQADHPGHRFAAPVPEVSCRTGAGLPA